LLAFALLFAIGAVVGIAAVAGYLFLRGASVDDQLPPPPSPAATR
jgi:hypothetical protein